jgi:hypothetical protein
MDRIIDWRIVMAMNDSGDIETWTDIAGFSRYLISSHGHIYSVNSLRRKSTYFTPRGYRRITLINDNGKRKGKFLHDLVGDAFVPATAEDKALKRRLHFKDGDRLNVHWTNLERQTRAYITQKCQIKPTGSSPFRGVFKLKTGWAARIYVAGKRYSLGVFETEMIAAAVYNACAVMIYTTAARQNPVLPLSLHPSYSVPLERDPASDI